MKDPICGMEVTAESAVGSMGWQGETYFFCSQHCLEKFRAEPAKYAHRAAAPRPPGTTAPRPSQYTCPMHPDVISDKPGSCPKCGMRLEPVFVQPVPSPGKY